MPLDFRIGHNLFLFIRRSPILLRRMTISSRAGVGARTTAVFSPPATDKRFELSSVPPNPLGEGEVDQDSSSARYRVRCLSGVVYYSRNSLNTSLPLHSSPFS